MVPVFSSPFDAHDELNPTSRRRKDSYLVVYARMLADSAVVHGNDERAPADHSMEHSRWGLEANNMGDSRLDLTVLGPY
jgi:hypothetical protein